MSSTGHQDRGPLPRPLRVDRDKDGDLVVTGIPSGSLLALLITDDVGDDPEGCDALLADVEAVRRGSSPGFSHVWNATRLVVDASGARLTFAMRIERNPPQELTLEVLTEALGALRTAVAR
jgi:hypothetical protein